MATSQVLYRTELQTVTPPPGGGAVIFAQLRNVPHGAYVVLAKAVVLSDNPQLGQVDFRLRAHPSDPDQQPQDRDQDFTSITLRLSSATSARAIANIALTLGIEFGDFLDIDFQYEGYDPLQVQDVKIAAIGVDDIHFHGK